MNQDPTKPIDVQTQEAFNPVLQRRGYIMVHTGDGKGKTTAGLGLVLRALGRRLRVLVIFFTKGGNHYGELFAFQQLRPALAQRLTIVQAGLDRIVFNKNQSDEDRLYAEAGWRIARRAIQSNQYDLIVLDEANIVVDFNFLPPSDLIATLQAKPEHLDILLTGRRAHPDLMAMAHLVSSIEPTKHYWDLGVKARPGIEY